MENKLRLLYALQAIDNKLDDIEEMKGDLPSVVRELEKAIKELESTIKTNEDAIEKIYSDRAKAEKDIQNFTEKIERYKNQQFKVKNNKEYDMLTREIDFSETKITELESMIDGLADTVQKTKTENETHTVKLAELNEEIEEKRLELAEVSKDTDKEEQALRKDRDKLVHKIAKPDVAAYERIRGAKGKAVVPVRRGACAGCFNAVPPQRVLELRKNNKIYMCERCGRILVSDEIVESSKDLV